MLPCSLMGSAAGRCGIIGQVIQGIVFRLRAGVPGGIWPTSRDRLRGSVITDAAAAPDLSELTGRLAADARARGVELTGPGGLLTGLTKRIVDEVEPRCVSCRKPFRDAAT